MIGELPDVPLRGIMEAYQAMHPSIKGRAYWCIGLEHWRAIRLDRRCLNMVIDPVNVGIHDSGPSFLHLPVVFIPEETIFLAIRVNESGAS